MAQKIQLSSAHRDHYRNPFFLTENEFRYQHLENSSRNSLKILFQSSIQAHLNCGKTIFRSHEPKYPTSISLSDSTAFPPLCILNSKIKPNIWQLERMSFCKETRKGFPVHNRLLHTDAAQAFEEYKRLAATLTVTEICGTTKGTERNKHS